MKTITALFAVQDVGACIVEEGEVDDAYIRGIAGGC